MFEKHLTPPYAVVPLLICRYYDSLVDTSHVVNTPQHTSSAICVYMSSTGSSVVQRGKGLALFAAAGSDTTLPSPSFDFDDDHPPQGRVRTHSGLLSGLR